MTTTTAMIAPSQARAGDRVMRQGRPQDERRVKTVERHPHIADAWVLTFDNGTRIYRNDMDVLHVAREAAE